MARLLTARFVETVKSQDKPVEYGDPSGVRLVVYPTGSKSYVHRYRAGGKTRKDTLGPAVGEGALTLAAAREVVARARRQLEQGIAIPRPVLATSSDSVASYVAQFLAKHHEAKNRPSTARAAEYTFGNIVVPAWGTRAVTDMRRRDIIELVEATAAARGPASAERVVRALSKFFGWLLARDVIAASPCPGVSTVLPRRPKARERTLDHHAELRPLLKAASTDNPSDCAIWVLVLTGCRRNEVGGMRWSELGPKAQVWTIPSERTKNHREHKVPLSAQAWKIINAQPRLVDCDFVFTARGGGSINGNWDRTKKRLSATAGLEEASWRLHDLRRTCASGLQRLGVRTEVIERALGHLSGTFGGI